MNFTTFFFEKKIITKAHRAYSWIHRRNRMRKAPDFLTCRTCKGRFPKAKMTKAINKYYYCPGDMAKKEARDEVALQKWVEVVIEVPPEPGKRRQTKSISDSLVKR
jgi:hypothetical protein